MKLIVCVDDKNGMCFNRRRQSSDRLLYPQIAALAGGVPVWMNGYSQKLFAGLDADVRVDEAFLDRAGEDEYCFAEDVDVTPYLAKARQLILYRWNRAYPSDLKLPALEGWHLVRSSEFKGNSHDKITQEVYER